MRVIVTGAAGFIGSNIVRGLNAIGVTDIIAVDDLTDGGKFHNLVGSDLADYLDVEEFYPRMANGDFAHFEAVFHQGACSDTMEHDGRYMLKTNFACSRLLLDACVTQGTRLIYASSAATYGDSLQFRESPEFERPKNVYGYSKLLFDNIVRKRMADLPVQVAGFRYFNVFGPGEQHKGRMASVAFHHFNQLRERGYVELFGAQDGYEAGHQSRDFVSVEDVVAVNLWFLNHPDVSGVFNLGTGQARSFNDLSAAVVNAIASRAAAPPRTIEQLVEDGVVRYIPFPDALKGRYQSFTQADLTGLRAAGCDHRFQDLETGTARYVAWLQANLASR